MAIACANSDGGLELTVVIVSHNSEEHIVRCVRDLLQASSGVRLQVVVVDNASSDNTTRIAQSEFGDMPWFRLVTNEKNSGFGSACNMGARLGTGESILFLNPDVFMLEGSTAALLAAMYSLDQCGACMPKAFWDDEMLFETSVLKESGPIEALVQHTSLRRLVSDSAFERFWRMDWQIWDSDSPLEAPGAPGGYLLVRRELFQRLDGFDEGFFLYYEDNDLCSRIRAAGWKIYIVPEARVIHYCGQSLKNFTGGNMAQIQRASLRRLYEKHYGAVGRIVSGLIAADSYARRLAKRVISGLSIRGNQSQDATVLAPSEGIELTWQAVPGADYYFLEVSNDPCFIHKVGAKVFENRYFLCNRSYQSLADDVYFYRAVPMVESESAGRIQGGRFRRCSQPGTGRE
ncbi:glycosyltransferase family 2 protein [bacterium]|nr:glycosyltransferase family 2 protein [bacterium]